eukprot:g74715.t1
MRPALLPRPAVNIPANPHLPAVLPRGLIWAGVNIHANPPHFPAVLLRGLIWAVLAILGLQGVMGQQSCSSFTTPCFNGGTCNNTANGYVCKCFDKYTGSRCEICAPGCISLSFGCFDPCTTSKKDTCKSINLQRSPCQACSVNCGGCLPGWKEVASCAGNNDPTCPCTVDANECDSNPCKNGGRCTDTGTLSFSCDCSVTLGFSGTYCEIPPEPCNIDVQAVCLSEHRLPCTAGINDASCGACKNGYIASSQSTACVLPSPSSACASLRCSKHLD